MSTDHTFCHRCRQPTIVAPELRCWSQVLAAIGVSFGASIVGGWLSFSSVAIPKMMNGTTADDPIQIDLFLGSWIASLFFIGNIVGCLAGGIVNQVDIFVTICGEDAM